MSNSPLINYTLLSPNYSSDKTANDRITIHHMAGVATVEACGAIFAEPSRQASSNYGIGNDGRIGLYVPEDKRSWCSSSPDNDRRAVTIEVSNSVAAQPWPVSDAAYNALTELCVDICKRNGKNKLLWFGDKDKTLAYTPKPDEMVMTVHRWFSATACPGDYLYERQGMIAEEVTKRLNEEDDDMDQDKFNQMFATAMQQYRQSLRDNDSGEWSKAARQFAVDNGIFSGSGTTADGSPNYMWEDLLTREQCAQVLYAFATRFGLA